MTRNGRNVFIGSSIRTRRCPGFREWTLGVPTTLCKMAKRVERSHVPLWLILAADGGYTAPAWNESNANSTRGSPGFMEADRRLPPPQRGDGAGGGTRRRPAGASSHASHARECLRAQVRDRRVA